MNAEVANDVDPKY